MENIANDWCKRHHATLLRCCKNGFYYMNANGDWYISYDEMWGINYVIKTGNGDCGYIILPDSRGCNPGEYGGYEHCDKANCPLKKIESDLKPWILGKMK